MKRTSLAVLALLGLTSIVFAEATSQPSAQVIDASDKAALEAAQNKDATVQGTVSEAAWSRTGKVMNIRFEGTGESGFVAVIFERSRDAFNKAFDGDVTKALPGAKVTVKGKVGTFRGSPQIILSRPDQLTIVEKAPAEAATTK